MASGISAFPQTSVIKSQQTGTISMPAAGADTVAVTLSPAVNPDTSLLSYLGHTNDISVSGYEARVAITNGGTKVTAYRDAVSNAATLTVGYQVLEFRA